MEKTKKEETGKGLSMGEILSIKRGETRVFPMPPEDRFKAHSLCFYARRRGLRAGVSKLRCRYDAANQVFIIAAE